MLKLDAADPSTCFMLQDWSKLLFYLYVSSTELTKEAM